MTFKPNEPNRDQILQTRHKVTKWREYKPALVLRSDIRFSGSEEALNAWIAPYRTTLDGPMMYSNIAIEATRGLGGLGATRWLGSGAEVGQRRNTRPIRCTKVASQVGCTFGFGERFGYLFDSPETHLSRVTWQEHVLLQTLQDRRSIRSVSRAYSRQSSSIRACTSLMPLRQMAAQSL